MLNLFNSLVTAAVLLILIVAGGESVMGGQKSDLLALSGAVFLLLMLPVLYKLAGRRPKGKPVRRR